MEQGLTDRRGADKHQSWGCTFDEQPTMALQIIPLVYDMGYSLLSIYVVKVKLLKGSMHTHETKFRTQR